MTLHKISIRNDVYQKLVKLKKRDESLSDLIERLSRGAKGSWNALEELNGIAGPDELNMEKKIEENRAIIKKSLQKRLGLDE
jgi:predicted CopG family antitoxin